MNELANIRARLENVAAELARDTSAPTVIVAEPPEPHAWRFDVFVAPQGLSTR